MKDSLAINGGTPVRTKPWLWNNALDEKEEQAVLRVIKSGNLSLFQGAYKGYEPYNFLGGPEVQALEKLAQEMMHVPHAVSVNSATSGLYAAIGALGLGFGDEVIVSPYTMSACAVAPLVYGAIPVFADVLSTGSLDPASIRERVTERTKAILVVHQFGIPAEMEEILAIAKEYNLKVIEDCAQAWGAMYQGEHVGTLGDIGVFSFNVHKTIQCGEGGLCVTKDPDLALRLQMIRNHGEAVVADAQYENSTNIVGFNYRMTELQAAVAHEQLKKLETLNNKRISFERIVSDGVTKHDCLSVPQAYEDRLATYYVYPLRYHAEKNNGIPRAEFVSMLKAEGILFAEGYSKPLYLLPIFQKRNAYKYGYPWSAPENQASTPNYDQGSCPNTEKLYKDEMLINIFMCPPQTQEDMHDIVHAIDKVIDACANT